MNNMQKAFKRKGLADGGLPARGQRTRTHMADGGGLRRQPHGGEIEGPGGPTDDEAGVYALSDDEYVLPADTVQAMGGAEALDQVRDATHTFVDEKNRPGLANGGLGGAYDWVKGKASAGLQAGKDAISSMRGGQTAAPEPAAQPAGKPAGPNGDWSRQQKIDAQRVNSGMRPTVTPNLPSTQVNTPGYAPGRALGSLVGDLKQGKLPAIGPWAQRTLGPLAVATNVAGDWDALGDDSKLSHREKAQIFTRDMLRAGANVKGAVTGGNIGLRVGNVLKPGGGGVVGALGGGVAGAAVADYLVEGGMGLVRKGANAANSALGGKDEYWEDSDVLSKRGAASTGKPPSTIQRFGNWMDTIGDGGASKAAAAEAAAAKIQVPPTPAQIAEVAARRGTAAQTAQAPATPAQAAAAAEDARVSQALLNAGVSVADQGDSQMSFEDAQASSMRHDAGLGARKDYKISGYDEGNADIFATSTRKDGRLNSFTGVGNKNRPTWEQRNPEDHQASLARTEKLIAEQSRGLRQQGDNSTLIGRLVNHRERLAEAAFGRSLEFQGKKDASAERIAQGVALTAGRKAAQDQANLDRTDARNQGIDDRALRKHRIELFDRTLGNEGINRLDKDGVVTAEFKEFVNGAQADIMKAAEINNYKGPLPSIYDIEEGDQQLLIRASRDKTALEPGFWEQFKLKYLQSTPYVKTEGLIAGAPAPGTFEKGFVNDTVKDRQGTRLIVPSGNTLEQQQRFERKL